MVILRQNRKTLILYYFERTNQVTQSSMKHVTPLCQNAVKSCECCILGPSKTAKIGLQTPEGQPQMSTAPLRCSALKCHWHFGPSVHTKVNSDRDSSRLHRFGPQDHYTWQLHSQLTF